MDNKQISEKLLEMAKFYQMTDEELMVIGKVVEMVRSADGYLISRKAVLELSKWDGREGLGSIIHAFDVERMPSVTPQPCEDAISRQEAEALFRDARRRLKPSDYKSAIEFHTRDLMLLNAEQFIHLLPSVTPQQKVGKWIATENEEMEIDGYYCSNCDLPMETEEKTAYCPNCWARMVEPQESEVQE